jgi:hypothetical protein
MAPMSIRGSLFLDQISAQDESELRRRQAERDYTAKPRLGPRGWSDAEIDRNLCPHEDQLREWLGADGVSFDDGLLSAALTRLETATVSGYNVRRVRGTELHRRNQSMWVPAARWPDRAMLLDPLSPWDSATYEPSDIVPYLIPCR